MEDEHMLINEEKWDAELINIIEFSFCDELEKLKFLNYTENDIMLETLSVRFDEKLIHSYEMTLLTESDNQQKRLFVYYRAQMESFEITPFYHIQVKDMEYEFNPFRYKKHLERIKVELQRLDDYVDLLRMTNDMNYSKYILFYQGYGYCGIKGCQKFEVMSDRSYRKISNEEMDVGGYYIQIAGMKRTGPESYKGEQSKLYFIGERLDKML
jgi:hypothetical protein